MKKLISMLLAVAMVMSLCVNVFAVSEANYKNGANESKLTYSGTETQLKIITFDSDQESDVSAVYRMTAQEKRRKNLTLTAAEEAAGYDYYSVTVTARLIWAAAPDNRYLSGGGLVFSVHPDAVSRENPYPSQTKMRNLVSFDQDIVTSVIAQYNTSSNFTNEEAKGIYKLKLAFAFPDNGERDPKTDAKGNRYQDFVFQMDGLKGKAGDQFPVKIDTFVAAADSEDTVRFKAQNMSTGKVMGDATIVQGIISLPTDIHFDANEGTASNLANATVPDVGLNQKIDTPTVADYNIRRTNTATGNPYKLVGWSSQKLTPVAGNEKSRVENLKTAGDFAAHGEKYTVTDLRKDPIYAVWAEDELPDPIGPGGTPIDVADYDKIVVRFKVVGGKWANGTTEIVATIDGSASTSGKLQSSQIPNVNTITRNPGYQLPGAWTVDKAGAPIPPNTTYDYQMSVKEYTYTYKLTEKPVTYNYINGEDNSPIDFDKTNTNNPTTPKVDDTIYDTNGDQYVVTDVGTPNDDNVVEVIAYPDTDKDGIPDTFQKNVTFKVVNGYWSGTDGADRTFGVAIKNNGKYTIDARGRVLGNADLTKAKDKNGNAIIPNTALAKAAKGSKDGTGAWDVDPTTAPGKTVTMTSPADPAIFTFTFSKYTYINGENGNEVIPVPVPDKDPQPGDKITDGSGNDYIVTDVPDNTPNGDPIPVTVYPDTDKNGIPDKFQWDIIFKVVGGKWGDNTRTDKKISVEIKNSAGKYELNAQDKPVGTATFTIPAAVNNAVRLDENYEETGKWDKPIKTTVNAATDPKVQNYTLTFLSKDIIFIDEYGKTLEIAKILRWIGMGSKQELGGSGEPTGMGYDPDMVSVTVYASRKTSTGTAEAIENNTDNLNMIKDMLAKAKFETYRKNGGWTDITTDTSKYINKLEATGEGSKIAITFTSNFTGIVRVTFENGSELVFITPGDINLDGEFDANDWSNLMRWVLEIDSSSDIKPDVDAPYTNFTVNGNSYNLWRLMADMDNTGIETLNVRNNVDSNDWRNIMYLTLEAWKK